MVMEKVVFAAEAVVERGKVYYYGFYIAPDDAHAGVQWAATT